MAISSINKSVGSFMNYTTKKLSKSLEKGLKQPASYAAKLMVISFISKDAVNCALYTGQSLNNKKIPEDKRKFVAFLDLFNGIINVGGQALSFVLFENLLVPKLESIYTGVLRYNKDGQKLKKVVSSKAALSEDNIYKHVEKALKDNADVITQKVKGVDVSEVAKDINAVTKSVMEKVGHSGKKGGDIVTGLGLLMSALTTNALIKRVASPLIATPLAGKLSDSMDAKAKAKKEEDSKGNDLSTQVAGTINNPLPNHPEDGSKLNKKA